MIREEAIEEIKQVRFNLNCQLNGTSRFEEAFEMAIKALEQQTCEDAVSREAMLGLFAQNADAIRPYSKTWEEVKALPSVNPKRTGHWIYDDTTNNWRCDKCGETPKTMGYVGTDKFMAEHFKFCNHCGTKMVEPQESEEA